MVRKPQLTIRDDGRLVRWLNVLVEREREKRPGESVSLEGVVRGLLYEGLRKRKIPERSVAREAS